MHVLEAHRAERARRVGCVGCIGRLALPGDRAHAVLHLADIVKDAGDLLRHPAGDIADLPGHGDRHRDDADFDMPRGPQPDREAPGADQKARIHQDQRDAPGRGHALRPAIGERVLVDRVADKLVLFARPGEELDGEDVGVAVDHPPGHLGAHLRHAARAFAHARQEGAQHHHINREPRHHRQRQPPIGAPEQRRAGAVDQDVPDRVDAHRYAFAHRRAGLHDPRGDAPGKIVLEEHPALAHHMPVVLPAHHIGEAWDQRLVGDERLREIG